MGTRGSSVIDLAIVALPSMRLVEDFAVNEITHNSDHEPITIRIASDRKIAKSTEKQLNWKQQNAVAFSINMQFNNKIG